MFIIIRFIILAGLVRLLFETEKPLLCAGIYTGIRLLFGIVSGQPFEVLLVHTLIGGALAVAYFWVLDKLLGHGLLFWLVAVGGVVIGIV